MRASTRGQRDFITRKYLDGGLVRVRRGDAWELSFCTPADDRIMIQSAVTGRNREVSWSEFDVESFSFEPRLFTLHNRVVHVSRNGVQSTQRSLRWGDFEVAGLLVGYFWETHRHDINSVKPEVRSIFDRLDVRLRGSEISGIAAQFVTPIESTLEQGLEHLKDGQFEAILNKDFAVSLSLNKDARPWLWYHKLPIGKIDVVERRVVVGHSDFQQELRDYLTHTHQSEGWSLHG